MESADPQVVSGSGDGSTNNSIKLLSAPPVLNDLKLNEGTTDQVDLSTNKNPLLNPIVMSTVAKYLPPRDLVCLRSTCKAWNSALIPELRRRGPIICLSSGGSSGHYFSPYGPGCYMLPSEPGASLRPPPTVSEFCTTMSTSATFPFGRIKIELNSSYSESKIHSFLSTYGQYITYLGLVLQHHPINLHVFRAMLYKQLPNLQELVLNQSSSSTCSSDEFFWRQDRLWTGTSISSGTPSLALKKFTLSIDLQGSDVTEDFLRDLFSAAGNLESLEITDRWTNFVGNTGTVLAALKGSSGGLAQLKHLDLDEKLTQAELLILTELGSRRLNPLQLQGFKLHHSGLHNGREDAAAFVALIRGIEAFIATQTASLESFIFQTFHGKPFRLDLPPCPKLKSMHFQLANDGSLRVNNCINMIHLSRRFPALQSFHYSDCGNERSRELQFIHEEVPGGPVPDDLQLVTLQELKVKPIYTSDELIQLILLFPKVTKLRMETYSSLNLLEWVWRDWKNLQVVDIVQKGFGCNHDGSGGIDEVLTGIEQRHHGAIARLIQTKEKDGGAGVGGDEVIMKKVLSLKTNPGVSDLTNLREFKLRFVDCYGRLRGLFSPRPLSYITDISFYFGFALLSKTLRSIDIDYTEKVSSTCQKFLKTTLGSEANISLHSDNACAKCRNCCK